MSGTIFFIIGESGSGKDTVAKEVARRLGVEVLPVHTTVKKHKSDIKFIYNTLEQINEVILKEVRQYVNGYYSIFYEDAKPDRSYVMVGPLEMYVNCLELFASRIMIPVYLKVSKHVRARRAFGMYSSGDMNLTSSEDMYGIHKVDGDRSLNEVVDCIIKYIQQAVKCAE